MADTLYSKIQLPSGDKSWYKYGVYTVKGTQTKSTQHWTGVIDVPQLYDGLTIAFYVPYNGVSGANVDLNLTLSDGTTTGAIACYYNNNSRITTHYGGGATVILTYWSANSISIGGTVQTTASWRRANYDSNTNTYDRIYHNGAIKASSAITAKNLIVGNANGYFHLKAGAAFDITYPLLYASADIAAAGTSTSTYIVIPFSVTTTQSITMTAYKAVFIKGTLNGNTFTPASTAPLTQTIPTTEDGYQYMYVGDAYETKNIYLMPCHPIYEYKCGKFQLYNSCASAVTELVNNGAKNVLQYNGLSSKSGNCTFTFNGDGSITVNGTTSSATSYVYLNLNGANVNVADLCNGNYILSGCPTNSSGLSLQVRGTDYTKSETGDGVELTTYSGSGIARVTIMVAKNSTIDNLTVRPMICTKAQWDISHNYEPYAVSNPKLTRSASELINKCGKNKLFITGLMNPNAGCGEAVTVSGITYTLNDDGTITANGTASGDSYCFFGLTECGQDPTPLDIGPVTTWTEDFFTPGNYVLSGCPINSSGISIFCAPINNVPVYQDTGSGVYLLPPNVQINVIITLGILIPSGVTASNMIFKPMICTIADWEISKEFEPYQLDLTELPETINKSLGPKNEICPIGLYGYEDQGQNVHVESTYYGTDLYFTFFNDGTIHITGQTGNSNFNNSFVFKDYGLHLPEKFFNNEYYLSSNKELPDNCVIDLTSSNYITKNGLLLPSTAYSSQYQPYIGIRIAKNMSNLDITVKLMMSHRSLYRLSRDWEPYGITKNQQDMGLIELVDNGPKNLLNHTAYTRTINGVTYTVNADRSIRIHSAGNNTQSLLYLVQNYTGAPAGNYVLSGCTGGSSTKYDLRIRVGSSTFYINYDGGTEFFYNGTDSFEASIVVRASQTVNITMKPMICTKADWDVSHEYQQYRPSYQTLCNTNEYITGTGTELAANANLNDYNYTCKMYSPSAAVSATISNTPWTTSGFQLITVQFITTASYMQFLLPNTITGKWYRRRYGSGAWSSWVEYDDASYLINGATAIASNTDMNTLKTPGVYTCASYSVASTLTNCAYKSSGFRCDVIQTSDTNCIRQIIQPNQLTTTGGNARYERSCVISSNTWSSWYKFEGTKIT